MANAPYTLVVYVTRIQYVLNARRKLYNKYGKLTKDKEWPKMPDGSRLRFIPMFRGDIDDEKMKTKLLHTLLQQAQSKARDVSFDIDIYDIHDRKSYLGTRSMDDIIHIAVSNEDEGGNIPIFKHIARRWTPNAIKIEYQVVVQNTMIDKATKFLRKMRNTLKENFGDEIMKHINNRQYLKISPNQHGS